MTAEQLSDMADMVDPAKAAAVWLRTGSWPNTWRQFYPTSSMAKAKVGGDLLHSRYDVRQAVSAIQAERVGVLLSKQDLLGRLQEIIDDTKEEKTSDRINAIRTYADMAGFNAEERKTVTTMLLTAEDVRSMEEAKQRMALPVPVGDAVETEFRRQDSGVAPAPQTP